MLIAAVASFTLVGCGEDEEPEIKNHYMLDGVEVMIDSTMFWYQSSMGGSAYIRLVNPIDGQEAPDLLKLYPNSGVNDLPGTYAWGANSMMTGVPEGHYDCGYTAAYAGKDYDWTSIGKTGSDDLVVEETDEAGIYHVTGEMILSVGSYDFSTGEFTETGTKTLVLDYTGVITDL